MIKVGSDALRGHLARSVFTPQTRFEKQKTLKILFYSLLPYLGKIPSILSSRIIIYIYIYIYTHTRSWVDYLEIAVGTCDPLHYTF